jgi:hypothetical protein
MLRIPEIKNLRISDEETAKKIILEKILQEETENDEERNSIFSYSIPPPDYSENFAMIVDIGNE